MPSEGAGPRFDVRVDERVLVEDLARCTVAARKAIQVAVAGIDEVHKEELRRAESRRPGIFLALFK